MPTAGLPRAQAQISDQRGYPTREWYAFFSRLLDESTDAGLSAQIQSILDRLKQLEAGSIADLSIIGLDSVSVVGQPSSGRVTITLDGDTTSPGAYYMYATDGDGTRGWREYGPERRPAAATVSALRVVTESASGVSPLDPTDDGQVAGLLGVSISAGDAGDEIRIKTGGTIDDAGWSWVPGFVYAGPNGTLTQTYPDSGWEIVIGYAPSATRLNLTFDEPVKLA